MPIASTDLIFVGTVDGLGGAALGVPLTDDLHQIFDVVTSDEALLGDTEYRCIYLKNNHASITLEAGYLFLTSNTTSSFTTIEFGLGTSALNADEQFIADEQTAPIGVVFSELVGDANSVSVGSIPPESTKAIWLKRVIDVSTPAINSDTAVLTLAGDTGA